VTAYSGIGDGGLFDIKFTPGSCSPVGVEINSTDESSGGDGESDDESESEFEDEEEVDEAADGIDEENSTSTLSKRGRPLVPPKKILEESQ